MLSRCANPICTAEFTHGQGRLFRFGPTQSHSLQHFWLCEICAEIYTLSDLGGVGVMIRRRAEDPAAALRQEADPPMQEAGARTAVFAARRFSSHF